MTPLYLPADMPGMLSAIYLWATTRLSGYSVIWGPQDGPYPGHPYAVLRMIKAPASGSGLPYRALDDTTAALEYDSEFMVRCEILSRAPLDPSSGMDQVSQDIHMLEASLWSSAQLEAFGVAGMALVMARPPVMVPLVEGFGFERRAYIEMVFRARTRFETDVPVLDIDSLAVQGTVDAGDVTGTVGV